MLDFVVALRSLGRARAFTIAAVLALGLAIAAGIAGFAVLDAVRFRALPFPNADRLVLISETPKSGCPTLCPVDYQSFALLRAQRFHSIDDLAAFIEAGRGAKALGKGADQVGVATSIVSGTLFDMLGAKPEMGRVFSPDEDRLGAPGTMVIGHQLWTTYFGSDPHVIGKTYRLSDELFTVIGVMPPGFAFETVSEVWLAASRYLDPRTGTSLRAIYVLARLAPGATMSQLQGELRTLDAEANRGRAEKNRTTFTVAPFRERYVQSARNDDLIFAAILGAVLLIGCANVASLVLVRAVRHARALAIRSALGAGRMILLRFLIAENALLCGAGLALGVLLAWWGLHALAVAGPSSLQGASKVAGLAYRIDWTVVSFGVVLSAVIAVALSAGPAEIVTRTDVQRTLREGGVPSGARLGHRLHQGFVVTQTACAVALLVAAGLLVRTVSRTSRVSLGYDPTHVISMFVVPVHAARTPRVYVPIFDRVLTELSALPQVDASAVRMQAPFAASKPLPPGVTAVARDTYDAAMTLDDGQAVDPQMQPKDAFGVSEQYFRVMGLELVAGRPFVVSDGAGAPPVAIVNEWAARHWWPNEPIQNAVGHSFSIDTAPGARAQVTVIGVVRDNLAGQPSVLVSADGPEVYRPYKQLNYWFATYYVRTSSSSAAMVARVQRTIMNIVPTTGPATGGPLTAQMRAQLDTVAASAMQFGAFAFVGLLLALTGLYGTLSHLVQQRTQEIGIRGALGADRGRLLWMVLTQAAVLEAAGIVVGVPLAAAMSVVIKRLLYGTPANDVIVYAAVCGLAFAVAMLAALIPARRAARIDPIIALRSS